MAQPRTSHDADLRYMVRTGMTEGWELFSLLTPTLYAGYILTRFGRPYFFANKFLRATWIGGTIGAGMGGGVTYLRYAHTDDTFLRNRRFQSVYNTARIRAEDHAVIGGLLMSVLTPALFWKRASIVNLVLGGMGLGSGWGLLTHWVRFFSGDPPPHMEAPTFPFIADPPDIWGESTAKPKSDSEETSKDANASGRSSN
ncbi:hypothetical protein FISHEDRAFT_53358 [Fistulina hepatica ATCC 64428]|nr:hypothetical protein FISHEDRAFT_53358 [Fistulina hepatica ATCC 64428]